jgi:glycosyltransferase involved in cell wall biosynthesis
MPTTELSNPLLSIVIPIAGMAGRLHNLKTTLSSISSNTQVILVHDYQDIETSQDLKALISQFKALNAELIEKYCGSPGKARNLGLSSARGLWIAFLDSDDIADISRYEEIIRDNELSDVVVANYEKVNLKNGIKVSGKAFTTSEEANLKIVTQEPGIWRFIFKRTAVGINKFPENYMGEDQVFLTRLKLPTLNISWHNIFAYQYFTEVQGQLTQNPLKRNEIRNSLRIIRNENIMQDKENMKFSSQIYAKMLIGLLSWRIFSQIKSSIPKEQFPKTRTFRWNWYVIRGLILQILNIIKRKVNRGSFI